MSYFHHNQDMGYAYSNDRTLKAILEETGATLIRRCEQWLTQSSLHSDVTAEQRDVMRLRTAVKSLMVPTNGEAWGSAAAADLGNITLYHSDNIRKMVRSDAAVEAYGGLGVAILQNRDCRADFNDFMEKMSKDPHFLEESRFKSQSQEVVTTAAWVDVNLHCIKAHPLDLDPKQVPSGVLAGYKATLGGLEQRYHQGQSSYLENSATSGASNATSGLTLKRDADALFNATAGTMREYSHARYADGTDPDAKPSCPVVGCDYTPSSGWDSGSQA